MVRQGDGTFRPRLLIFAEKITFQAGAASQRFAGFEISCATIRRLLLAGFLRGRCVGSDAAEVEIDSLLDHMRATRFTALFWDELRTARYRQSQSRVEPKAHST